MSKIELVRLAFDVDDPARGDYLSDDFQWTDELGSPPVERGSWVAAFQPFGSSMSDLSLVIDDIREEGDTITVTSHVSGTFVNDLDLSAMGLGVIPATGESFVSPVQRDRVSFDGDKISEIHNMETGPDAGMGGLLKVLGVDPD
jgi:hypothetical protein